MATPDFQWSRFYYPEILDALLRLKGRIWPEHTEDSEADPVVQLYRSFALISHLQACRLDHVAREQYLATAHLRSSFVARGREMDYRLAVAVPAETELVADLSRALSAPTEVVKGYSLSSTRGDADVPVVVFERPEEAGLQATATGVWTVVQDDGGVVTLPALPAALWAGVPAVDDAVYFRHPELMWDRLDLEVSVAAVATTIRWEYRDDRRGTPDVAFPWGAFVRAQVSSLVGSSPADGLQVTIRCLLTGVSETCTVVWGGWNRVDTIGTLGQAVVSSNPADYEVTAEWCELPDLVDGTAGLTQNGTVTWSLPQDTDHDWTPGTIGTSAGYLVRARVVAIGGGPTSPTLAAVAEARKTTWSVLWPVTQGRRVTDRLGVTTADAGQAFEVPRAGLLELVSLTVNGEEWSRVTTLLASAGYDRHFTFDEDPDGSWWVRFGDGANGKIPQAGVVVEALYRIGGDVDGNVGAGTIVVDRAGNSALRNVRNPRAAAGWVAQEGLTDESLDALRVTMPASLRTLGRAVTPPDCETIAVAFRTTDGSQVAARALAIEEGSGAKTVDVICVGPGGAAPTATDLAELDAHFNGALIGLQQVGGVAMANTRCVLKPYVARLVDVTATLYVLSAYAPDAQAQAQAAIEAILQPLAFRVARASDGTWVQTTEYLWTWGGQVAPTVLQAAIALAVSGLVNLVLTLPAAPVLLGATELPRPGVVTVTVVAV